MNWWYERNGDRIGPVSEKELGELLKSGEIQAKTLVWSETMAEWGPATGFALPEMDQTVPSASRWPWVSAVLLVIVAMALIAVLIQTQLRTTRKEPGFRTASEEPNLRARSTVTGARVLYFPEDRSMGRLVMKDLSPQSRWQYLAEARGEVTVPVGKEVDLVVAPEAFADLSPLASLDQDALCLLIMTSGEVGDEDLKHLEHLRSLRRLDINGPGVTDVGVTRIAKLKQLEDLHLLRSGMSDAGLAQLAQLPALLALTLDESANLTDAGLRALDDMGGLIHLSLDFNPQFTDALAPHVARLTALEKLFLSKTQLTDDGLAQLQGLSKLKKLSLEETQITDDGLKALHGMRSLRALYLYGTGVTEAGAERLRQVIPGCQIDLQGDGAAPPTQKTVLQVGDPAPELAIAHWVKGDPIKISDGRNENIFVVEFWATWCPPCRTSIPHLTEVQNRFRNDGVVVVGVSKEEFGTVEPFVQAQGEKMEYNVVVDAEGRTYDAYMNAAGQNGIPCAFIVDQGGETAWIGHPMNPEFERTLVRLIQNPNQDAANLSAMGSGTASPREAVENASIAGTYTLVSIGGNPLPYAPMHQGQQAIEVSSGTITLKDGGAFVSNMSYGNRPASWPASRDSKGTCTHEGGALNFKWEGAGQTKVTIDGNTLVMDNEGMPFVYQLSPEANEATAATAARPTKTYMLPGDVPLVMVVIPSGTFMMGTTKGDGDERPVHEVTISRDFQLGQTEVTKAQWEAVMGTRPWSGQSSASGSTLAPLRDPDTPALDVRWDDAQSFITTLNTITGETFRLPTEAEWEYACRAGTTTEYYFGNSPANLSNYAWWDGNADDVGERYAHTVAQLIPNDFGLYDMHGNVWEWCADWYDSRYYSSSPSVDPAGPPSGPSRVIRGGTWYYLASSCRSANRSESGRRNWQNIIGFRLAADLVSSPRASLDKPDENGENEVSSAVSEAVAASEPLAREEAAARITATEGARDKEKRR